MVRQLTRLTGEEGKKYEALMQMSVRNLREEAKREGLCAGAKTKSELAYSMVKEKRPRRKPSNTPENLPPNRSPEGKGSDIRRGSRYSPPCGVASHPQHHFPPKFSPAQLLAGADEEVNPTYSEQNEDTVTAMAALDRTRDQIFDEILKLCKDSEQTGAESQRMVDYLENWRRIAPHWSLEKMSEVIQDGPTTTRDHSLRNIEAQLIRYFHRLSEGELNRPGSTYQADKKKLNEDAEELVAYALRARQLVSNWGERRRDEPGMDHRHEYHVSVPELRHPFPSYILDETNLDSIASPPSSRRSSDNEAERARSRQRCHQSPLHDERLAYSSPSSAERGQEHAIDDQAGWPCSTQWPEQLPLPSEVYDMVTPSPVIYHPSSTFSIQPQRLSYIRSETLVPFQHRSPTSGRLSSYPAPSYEKHVSEPIDSPRLPPTELLEEYRTLPPIREALNFLSW